MTATSDLFLNHESQLTKFDNLLTSSLASLTFTG